MGNKAWIVMLGLGAAAGLGLAVGIARSEAQVEERIARLEEQVAAWSHRPQAKAGEVQRQLATAVALLDRRAEDREAQRAEAIKAAPAGDDGRAEGRPTEAPSFAEAVEHVGDAYEREAVDPQWSKIAAAQLDAAIRASLPPGSRLEGLECRATMCRIALSHATAEAQGTLLTEAFAHWPGALLVAEERAGADGRQQVTLIAAREGAELPFAGR